MNTFTLTRAEAYAIDCNLVYTNDLGSGDEGGYKQRADCYAAIRRLQLEATIRDAGLGWHRERPAMLDMYGTCPASLALPAEGLLALVELLPAILARVAATFPDPDEDVPDEHRAQLEANREALRGLDERLDVEIPQPVA